MQDILKRKGARKVQDVPQDVLDLLHQGQIPTVNLIEWLALDHLQLVQHTFSTLGIEPDCILQIEQAAPTIKKPTSMAMTKLIGRTLFDYYKNQPTVIEQIIQRFSAHPSDCIRCYAPYLIGENTQLHILQKLDKAKHLVADKHFGVREVVWMALRPAITDNLTIAINHLATWTADEDENIRRFTTEATRPRGVWCQHIATLKENPAQALALLEPLHNDASKYVRDSVGNWLNDASKSAPDFVRELCQKWQQQSNTKATQYIVKKALRTLNKK